MHDPTLHWAALERRALERQYRREGHSRSEARALASRRLAEMLDSLVTAVCAPRDPVKPEGVQ
jgi:hypothetical protein